MNAAPLTIVERQFFLVVGIVIVYTLVFIGSCCCHRCHCRLPIYWYLNKMIKWKWWNGRQMTCRTMNIVRSRSSVPHERQSCARHSRTIMAKWQFKCVASSFHLSSSIVEIEDNDTRRWWFPRRCSYKGVVFAIFFSCAMHFARLPCQKRNLTASTVIMFDEDNGRCQSTPSSPSSLHFRMRTRSTDFLSLTRSLHLVHFAHFFAFHWKWTRIRTRTSEREKHKLKSWLTRNLICVSRQ